MKLQTFKIRCHLDLEDKWVEVKGYPVTFDDPDFGKYKFFAHHTFKLKDHTTPSRWEWTITEQRTGLAVTSDSTMKAAIARAKEQLILNGVVTFRKVIKKAGKQYQLQETTK